MDVPDCVPTESRLQFRPTWMNSRAVLLAATTFLLVACGGSSTGSTTHATPTTASAAISLLDGSAMKDAKCDQTGLSHTSIASGNIIGTCRISKTGSTYSLLQQYSVTVTAQVETTSRTVTSYAVSLLVGGDTYYRTGQNPSGGSYAHSTVAPAHSWSELFFAGANFSNLQQATVNGTAAWTVDATTPGLVGVSKTGKLYIRSSDGYLMEVDYLNTSGATTLRTKFGFTAWDTGTPVSATPPQ
jgi:hypothetical protein